jgi:glycosyltransferase involved in cell wall biosynthesis
VDPLAVGGLAEALTDLASNEHKRKTLGYAGRAHATAFTWQATATQTLAAYEAALAGS